MSKEFTNYCINLVKSNLERSRRSSNRNYDSLKEITKRLDQYILTLSTGALAYVVYSTESEYWWIKGFFALAVISNLVGLLVASRIDNLSLNNAEDSVRRNSELINTILGAVNFQQLQSLSKHEIEIGKSKNIEIAKEENRVEEQVKTPSKWIFFISCCSVATFICGLIWKFD